MCIYCVYIYNICIDNTYTPHIPSASWPRLLTQWVLSAQRFQGVGIDKVLRKRRDVGRSIELSFGGFHMVLLKNLGFTKETENLPGKHR